MHTHASTQTHARTRTHARARAGAHTHTHTIALVRAQYTHARRETKREKYMNVGTQEECGQLFGDFGR